MQMKTILILISIVLSFTHCTTYDFSKTKVQQGNILSPARIAHLKLGMSKSDVAILMGTSLTSPLFREDRWDYAYTWRRGSGDNIVRHLTLYFSGDHLIKIEKDVSAKKH